MGVARRQLCVRSDAQFGRPATPTYPPPFRGRKREWREVKAQRNPGTPSKASTALAGFRFHLRAPRFGGLDPSEARRASVGGPLNPGSVLREQMISFPLQGGRSGWGSRAAGCAFDPTLNSGGPRPPPILPLSGGGRASGARRFCRRAPGCLRPSRQTINQKQDSSRPRFYWSANQCLPLNMISLPSSSCLTTSTLVPRLSSMQPFHLTG